MRMLSVQDIATELIPSERHEARLALRLAALDQQHGNTTRSAPYSIERQEPKW